MKLRKEEKTLSIVCPFSLSLPLTSSPICQKKNTTYIAFYFIFFTTLMEKWGDQNYDKFQIFALFESDFPQTHTQRIKIFFTFFILLCLLEEEEKK